MDTPGVASMVTDWALDRKCFLLRLGALGEKRNYCLCLSFLPK